MTHEVIDSDNSRVPMIACSKEILDTYAIFCGMTIGFILGMLVQMLIQDLNR